MSRISVTARQDAALRRANQRRRAPIRTRRLHDWARGHARRVRAIYRVVKKEV